MRIAFAAAALLYIAPHLGHDAASVVRPLVGAKTGPAASAPTDESVADMALAYCRRNPEPCLKFARAALGAEEAGSLPPTAGTALRPAFADAAPHVPLPPARPQELRPALR